MAALWFAAGFVSCFVVLFALARSPVKRWLEAHLEPRGVVKVGPNSIQGIGEQVNAVVDGPSGRRTI
jgi:hypothetical protein